MSKLTGKFLSAITCTRQKTFRRVTYGYIVHYTHGTVCVARLIDKPQARTTRVISSDASDPTEFCLGGSANFLFQHEFRAALLAFYSSLSLSQLSLNFIIFIVPRVHYYESAKLMVH